MGSNAFPIFFSLFSKNFFPRGYNDRWKLKARDGNCIISIQVSFTILIESMVRYLLYYSCLVNSWKQIEME